MPKRPPSSIRIEGSVAYVSLTQGLEAIIDVADLPLVRGYAWRVQTLPKGHAYAIRSGGKTASHVLMHRAIMHAPSGMLVDHKDGDGLNNRRANLRFATAAQNNMNMLVSRRNRLGIKGVSTLRSGRFSARIENGDHRVYLGTYSTPEEASAAYFGAARVLFGDYAKR